MLRVIVTGRLWDEGIFIDMFLNQKNSLKVANPNELEFAGFGGSVCRYILPEDKPEEVTR